MNLLQHIPHVLDGADEGLFALGVDLLAQGVDADADGVQCRARAIGLPVSCNVMRCG